MNSNSKLTKKAYIKLVETLVRYGHDISDYLNPTYKRIDAQKCVDYANEIIEYHEGKEWWENEEKITINNL